MTGIPVYTQAPINASIASGTTPQTTAPASSSQKQAPSTTTAAPTSSHPSAQPGASPFPQPTTAAAQRYAPTPTTKTDARDSPAAPQPGAVPRPLGSSTLPPPPKAGETYNPPAPTQQAYPPQMSIPPPTTTSTYGGQPAHSTTSTTTAPLGTYPISVPEVGGQRTRTSLEHPPGYQQNVYASEMTSDQRRAQEAANTVNASSILQESKESMMDTDGVWNTAKKWIGQAGEKISEAEAEVWRKINKE